MTDNKNKKTPKVICRMVAHNSEKTIARAIESVLNQTYKNIELHIGIRASTDSTADISDKYASKDSRIRVIINKQAFDYDEGNNITDYYHEYDVTRDYVCFMDGDDEYKPEFLEKMVPFAENNNLDIACCGFDVIDVTTGQKADKVMADKEIIVEGEQFGTMLPEYYRYMRTRWAKICRLSVTAKLDLSRIYWIYYNDDLIETTEYFRNAERIGVYPGTFYKWYRSDGSLSFKWDGRRIESDRIVYDTVIRYLEDKAGYVSDKNKEYLTEAYMVAIMTTTRVLHASQLTVQEKFEATHDILTCGHTRSLADIQSRYNVIRDKFFQDAITWIIQTPQLRKERYFGKISEIFYVTKILPEDFPGWSEQDIIGLMMKFAEKYG